MVGLVERKLSKSALWCRRLAVFAMPYFLITIIMHRWDKITTNQAMGLLAFGFVILVVSILLAMRAIVQLWNDGAKGGKTMILGLFLSITMLTPFLVFAVLAMRYPPINDVSTNIFSPPNYSAKTLALRRSRAVPLTNNVGEGFNDDEMISILVSYPKIGPRRYPAGPERVFKAVSSIIEDRGWDITDIRGLPENNGDKQEQVETKKKKTKKKSKKAKPPENEDNGLEATQVQDIYFDAVTTSLIFSFKHDVVIKIVSEEENTLVEMRSAARWGVHDFGENARIIKKFMHDLDQELLGIAGEG